MIGVLATAVKVSLSVKYGSDVHGSQKQKCEKRTSKKQNYGSSKKLSVRWKGARKMTLICAAFMVSIGIPERDSVVCG
ncbi:hypothetical protein [Parablautia intestinalis]|uniref:hypothetical protein n=1 Tax=Parablautia intestinalis TaxID=2320100 RepID=UPI0015597933|nr:hypothetical protein [Parablautia intestinalis]